MKTVIYFDMLIAVNLILDFFLLLGAGKLSGCIAGQWRYLAGAAVAGVLSLVILLFFWRVMRKDGHGQALHSRTAKFTENGVRRNLFPAFKAIQISTNIKRFLYSFK